MLVDAGTVQGQLSIIKDDIKREDNALEVGSIVPDDFEPLDVMPVSLKSWAKFLETNIKDNNYSKIQYILTQICGCSLMWKAYYAQLKKDGKFPQN